VGPRAGVDGSEKRKILALPGIRIYSGKKQIVIKYR
jgi:hypothetical protein